MGVGHTSLVICSLKHCVVRDADRRPGQGLSSLNKRQKSCPIPASLEMVSLMAISGPNFFSKEPG